MRNIYILIAAILTMPACAHLEAAGSFSALIYERCGDLKGEEQRKCIEAVVAHAAECAVENPPADADTDGEADPGE